MDVSWDYYRIFYQVARCRSITKAAAVLYSNQPNVTHTIKLLERELGCSLFRRSNRGVTLTPEGEMLYAHISPAAEHILAARQELTLERELQLGSVSIGASEIALRCVLLRVLRQFRLSYPGIHVRVSNNSTLQAVRALQEELVDFAVVTTPVPTEKGMVRLDLKDIQEIPVCSDTLSLPDRPLSPRELSEFPLISLGQSTMTYRLYESWFAEHGLPFCPDIEAATSDQILPLVKSDLGIGFVPPEFLTQESVSGLRRLSLTVPAPSREVCLLTLQNRPLSIAARKLYELLEAKAY